MDKWPALQGGNVPGPGRCSTHALATVFAPAGLLPQPMCTDPPWGESSPYRQGTDCRRCRSSSFAVFNNCGISTTMSITGGPLRSTCRCLAWTPCSLHSSSKGCMHSSSPLHLRSGCCAVHYHHLPNSIGSQARWHVAVLLQDMSPRQPFRLTNSCTLCGCHRWLSCKTSPHRQGPSGQRAAAAVTHLSCQVAAVQVDLGRKCQLLGIACLGDPLRLQLGFLAAVPAAAPQIFSCSQTPFTSGRCPLHLQLRFLAGVPSRLCLQAVCHCGSCGPSQ